jgi:hypothetical protein
MGLAKAQYAVGYFIEVGSSAHNAEWTSSSSSCALRRRRRFADYLTRHTPGRHRNTRIPADLGPVVQARSGERRQAGREAAQEHWDGWGARSRWNGKADARGGAERARRGRGRRDGGQGGMCGDVKRGGMGSFTPLCARERFANDPRRLFPCPRLARPFLTVDYLVDEPDCVGRASLCPSHCIRIIVIWSCLKAARHSTSGTSGLFARPHEKWLA